MAFSLALSGKGGTGKTTLTSLIVRWLTENTDKSVFAVDADPNSTLAPALGVKVEGTVAQLRENILKDKFAAAPGMNKQRFLEYAIEQMISEGSRFDLLTMGRPEGPECYCYVNHLLRDYMRKLSERNAYVVIDNEAGMEHLSRRTTDNIEVLLIVADESPVALRAVDRIYDLSNTLHINIKNRYFVLNRKKSDSLFDDAAFSKKGLPMAGVVPYDSGLDEVFGNEKSVFELPKESPAYVAVGEILSRIIPNN